MTINEKKYELKLDKVNKILSSKVGGSFRPTDANGFLQEYNTILKGINANEYKLMFNCKELKVTGTDIKSGVNMTEMLKGCIEQYKKDGFKKVVVDCEKNIILKMQISRISKEVGILNFEVTS